MQEVGSSREPLGQMAEVIEQCGKRKGGEAGLMPCWEQALLADELAWREGG